MNNTRLFGLVGGLLTFTIMLILPAPEGMELTAWRVAAMTILMAIWWMTEAMPLTVTALLPFLLVPTFGVMDAEAIASEYYSPILFLILGGAFLALTIERVGLHRRVALFLLKLAPPTATGLLFAFMAATAAIGLLVSNTSTALIMIPIALAVIRAAGIAEGETEGFAGAVIMGTAFGATISGFGTLVATPTNAIAAGLIEKSLGVHISFLDWLMFGLPVVIISVPIATFVLARVQKLKDHPFDAAAATAALGEQMAWSRAERRVVPIVLLVITAWITQRWLAQFFPEKALTDGTIAVAGSLLLFVIPDGTGRPLLVWKEANKAPWGVIMLFGGGLALAAAMSASGLATWLGTVLAPLGAMPMIVLALIIVGLTILVTEFASNVATASGIMPVLTALIAATGADPILLALPVAMAASWGFMLPSGTGPNALAWSTGHIALPRMLKAGLALDIIGAPLLIGVIWMIATLT
ncbi:MAG TPA: DASS family sodium-coupled anion symporter [Sphingopyxis sp.]|nr:DASS family sodium-coupled anion symporter [Sphingopyxis sp.]HMP44225.1 DASS family sodium-coupled anion symporter [Sphingopyxis sp.]HMQ18539.1 DASS family sodium-coupled anion symporter [Sphingopyxis sp.]